MKYIYKKKTFSPVGDEKIPDGEYILITDDNVSALIIATEKFQG